MKFLAVCGFGVGSSMVLKMSLVKACKERNLDCDIENTDVTSVKGMQADAVFTSPELAEDLRRTLSCPVYGIQRYMDVKEVGNAIDQFLADSK